jgi:hypothetical protein
MPTTIGGCKALLIMQRSTRRQADTARMGAVVRRVQGLSSIPGRPPWRCKAVRFASHGAGLISRQRKLRSAKMAALQRQPEGLS